MLHASQQKKKLGNSTESGIVMMNVWIANGDRLTNKERFISYYNHCDLLFIIYLYWSDINVRIVTVIITSILSRS